MPYSDPDKQRAYVREWMRRRREEFFADKACEWCGSSEELQLHHRDRSAKVTHKFWSFSKERRDAEIAKCVVVCGPCHRRSHAETRHIEAELRHPHGTYNRYALGCHCDLCRLGNRDRLHIQKRNRERRRFVSDITGTYIGVVQRGEERADQETELVTIREEHGLPIIELTDGTRITAVEPAGKQAA